MDNKVRAHAVISGRVQGVCFRMETKREADRSGVSGWVRNRRDGTVEAVFEGEQKDVAAILEWCRQGPPISEVTDVDVKREAYTGSFTKFEIMYENPP